MNRLYTRIFALTGVLALCLLLACKKFVDVPPPSDQIISETVFTNDATAISAVTGIYSQMSNNIQFASAATTIYAGLCADGLMNFTSGADDQFSRNELSPLNGTILSSFWQPAFKYIYTTNLCLEKLSETKTVSPNIKDQLSGEAKFIRAFCYFNLVNLFGDVPLVLSSDYRENSSLGRAPSAQVWERIITDLREAKDLLSATPTASDRTRPDKYAVSALLARAYLYTGEWAKAKQEASVVIGSGKFSLPADLRSVFLKTSAETILQLQPVYPNYNTWEGYLILPYSSNSTPTYLLSDHLLNSFEAGDLRKQAWDTSCQFGSQILHLPCKYKVYSSSSVSEYYIVLRLAEQYLIRAEASARLNDIAGAQMDLNVIRQRAGLSDTPAQDQPSILLAIEKERFTELFSEWGHRWFDLKRTGRATQVLAAIKSDWSTTDILWPIPESQININSSLKQNPGY